MHALSTIEAERGTDGALTLSELQALTRYSHYMFRMALEWPTAVTTFMASASGVLLRLRLYIMFRRGCYMGIKTKARVVV